MEKYGVIGLMSGSSLDGLDIAYCTFTLTNGKWSFNIEQTDVVAYSDEWMQDIKSMPIANAKKLWECHAGLGNYFGECVKQFIAKNKLEGKVDLVASHGHTIFHFPEKRFTAQVGDGAALAAITNLPVICDFRSADIADGGQGTPIVPIGDKYLFPDHKLCLNIGGIANVSCKVNDSIIAFDICVANQILNMLANRLGQDYDKDGALAQSGKLVPELLNKLNALHYYDMTYPKSLDNSFSKEVILPIVEEFKISIEDKLRTYTEHVAQQLGKHLQLVADKEKINFASSDKMLVTGGGAFNSFLIERMQANVPIQIEVPTQDVVKFKEALVIAFMGVLRMRNEVNVLKSVTGAAKDSVGGAVYRP